MNLETGSAARRPPRHRDLNSTAGVGPEPKKSRGVSMGQDGAVASSQHRGHPVSLTGQGRMVNRVDTSVDAMQLPRSVSFSNG